MKRTLIGILSRRAMKKILGLLCVLMLSLLVGPVAARADSVLDWNAIAVNIGRSQPLWPEKPSDDFAINRSVVATLETSTRQDLQIVPRKQRINARTKH